MLGVVAAIASSALLLWLAAASAAALVLFCALTLWQQPRWETGVIPAFRFGYVAVAATLVVALLWVLLARTVAASRTAERLALEQRAHELTTRTLAPGSPLACLDGLIGERVTAACEKALFASPASVAAATSYVAEQLALLSATTAYVGRGGRDVDDLLQPLRRALEADRFGFVAHLLATRDGCTGQNCPALALLHDPVRVRANFTETTFDHHLEHYLALWAAATPDGAVADAAQARPAAPQPNAPRKVVNIDFPTAASIPPISIMNPEPTGPVLPGVAAAAAANPNPPPAAQSRHAHKQTSNQQAANPAPPTGAQTILPGPPTVEPIWPEPVPPPPATPPAAAPGLH